MKKYEFDIIPSVINIFFPEFRVKTKTHILNILLETVRYVNSYNSLQILNSKGKIVLIIDKMSRLFYSTENKAYSISFPFYALKDGEVLKFSFEDIDIDAFLISNLISAISSGEFIHGDSLDFSDSITDYEKESKVFWQIFRELLMYEDGYIRYDYDDLGFQTAKKNGYEHRHPLNHFDLFYTNKATFKVGLENRITINDFVDILDINTDCKYMKKSR